MYCDVQACQGVQVVQYNTGVVPLSVVHYKKYSLLLNVRTVGLTTTTLLTAGSDSLDD